MFIDKGSYKALNIQQIVEQVKPLSELGKRLKQNSKPFSKGREAELRSEYKKVQDLTQGILSNRDFRANLTSALSKIDNIKATISHLSIVDELTIQEFFEIKQFLFYYEKICRNLKITGLTNIVDLYPLAELFELLDPEDQRSPSFHISNKYSERLARFRGDHFELTNRLKKIEQSNYERAKSDLNLKFTGKQVTVSRQNREQLAKLNQSKWFSVADENFANVTFLFRQTDDFISLAEELNRVKMDVEAEESSVRISLTRRIKPYENILLQALNETAKLDYLTARAIFGIENSCVIPKVNCSSEQYQGKDKKWFIQLEHAVNLPVKKDLENAKICYQSVNLEFNNRVNIITGANMAGKSTVLKTLGQLFYLFSYAIPLPCAKAEMPTIDFIFYSSATEESHRTDLSSFASELVAINSAVAKQGEGLYLIDEFARGTNPHEGEAFAQAVIERLLDKSGFVFSATHFSSPSEIRSADHFRIIGLSQEDYDKLKDSLSPYNNATQENLKCRIKELHRYMDYSIEQVEPLLEPPQAALMIAEILGIDKGILDKARSFLKD